MVTREVLVLEDDTDLSRCLARICVGSGFHPRLESSARAALAVLSSEHCAAIIDLVVADGPGFDVVEQAVWLGVPCLILTGSTSSEHINRAQYLGVEFACKPADRQNIERFLARAARHLGKVEDVVAHISTRHNLTPAQRRLIDAALESSSHETLSERLGISTNTIKTHVRHILARTGAESLEQLVSELRTAALRR
jgi:DNA-binding NarL/FixJ family response regulator